jgi:hypothetical protein
MFKIHNLNLNTAPTPLESLGGLACRIYDPALPQYRPTLCVLNYGVGRSNELNAPLTVTDGFATVSAPEFEQVNYVELGGDIYTEAEDLTAPLPGEYVYNPYTEILTIRIY